MLAGEALGERLPAEVLTRCRDAMQEDRSSIERRLDELTARPLRSGGRVMDALRYSLLGGGQRLRPLLTMLTASSLGAPRARALDAACAIEMIHTASLILDDMPCMDDAELRRGRPANHRVFGEHIAHLAVVSLISEAFALVSGSRELSALQRSQMVHTLSRAIGVEGLCGGQASDLQVAEGTDCAALVAMEMQKTGALFVSSVRLGAVVASADDQALEALCCYAREAGLAFQMFDDLLDVYGDAGALGKDVGQDAGRITFTRLLGPGAAERLALERCRAALGALADLEQTRLALGAFLQFMIEGYGRRSGRLQ